MPTARSLAEGALFGLRHFATLVEKPFEQRRCLGLADAGIDFGPVQALGMIEHPRAVFDCAALGIAGRVIQPRDPGMGDGACAHRAGLQRHVKVAVVEPFGPARAIAFPMIWAALALAATALVLWNRTLQDEAA